MSDDQRQRQRPTPRPAPGGSDGGDGSGLGDIRERADRLRNLGSGIIADALSGNSERFLEHSRQQGGQ